MEKQHQGSACLSPIWSSGKNLGRFPDDAAVIRSLLQWWGTKWTLALRCFLKCTVRANRLYTSTPPYWLERLTRQSEKTCFKQSWDKCNNCIRELKTGCPHGCICGLSFFHHLWSTFSLSAAPWPCINLAATAIISPNHVCALNQQRD